MNNKNLIEIDLFNGELTATLEKDGDSFSLYSIYTLDFPCPFLIEKEYNFYAHDKGFCKWQDVENRAIEKHSQTLPQLSQASLRARYNQEGY